MQLVAWSESERRRFAQYENFGLMAPHTLSSWVYFYLSLDFAHAYRQQLLRYRDEIVQAHCHRGGIGAFVNLLGVGPPGGKFFPNFVFRFRSENCCESCP